MKYYILVSIFCLANLSTAAIIRVPGDVHTIQAGLNGAQVGDTVVVARGSWHENLNIQRSMVLAGEYILAREKHLIKDTEVIGRITFAENLTNATEVIGLHFTDSRSDGGGALSLENSYPKISHCMFTENNAPRGGVAYLNGWQADSTQFVKFEYCLFENNLGSWGGCFNISNINVEINSCTFNDNVGDWSGAIFISSNRNNILKVIDCSFQRQTAQWGNSAMITEGRSTLLNCIFANETGGEAIEIGSRGNHIVEGCTFTKITGKAINYSGLQGGSGVFKDNYIHHNTGQAMHLQYCSTLRIEGCDISENTNAGGATIYTNAGTPTFTNCRITNNSNTRRNGIGGIISLNWHDHGGIFEGCLLTGNNSLVAPLIDVDRNGNVYFDRTTIAGNICGNSIYLGGDTHMNITNSIIQSADGQNDISLSGSDSLRATYTVVNRDRIAQRNGGNIDFGVGIIADDPIFNNPENNDFHISDNSPCIDSGDPGAEEDPDGSRADMGAFYYSENANIEVSPIIICFLEVQATKTDSQLVKITNYGRETLHIEEFVVEGSDCFTLRQDQGGFDLDPFNAESVMVFFTPDFRGEYRAVLTVVSDDPDKHRAEIPLQGIGRIIPMVAVSPDTIRIVDTPVGESDSVEVVISNSGLESATISDVWIQPGDAPFRISGPQPSQKIYPDSALSYRVIFEPIASGNFEGLFCLEYKDTPLGAINLPIHGSSPNSVEGVGDIPEGFHLDAVYPQPLNGVGNIEFTLPTSSKVTLKVFDVQGRLVLVLVDETLVSGKHSVQIDPAMLPAGVYVSRLEAGRFTQSVKLILVK